MIALAVARRRYFMAGRRRRGPTDPQIATEDRRSVGGRSALARGAFDHPTRERYRAVARGAAADRADVDIGLEWEESRNSLVGSVAVGTAGGAPREGGSHNPGRQRLVGAVAGRRSGLARRRAPRRSRSGRTPATAGTRPVIAGVRGALRAPGGCEKALRASCSSDVVVLACDTARWSTGSLRPGTAQTGLPPARKRCRGRGGDRAASIGVRRRHVRIAGQ